MAITTRLSPEAWAALPPAVREYLDIRPGEEMDVEFHDGCVTLRPRRGAQAPHAEAPHAETFPFFSEWSAPSGQGTPRGR